MKSIGIPDDLHVRLKRYCDKNNLKLGEFIETSLQYLEKNGINPAEHESPTAEIQRLIKRVDQVVAFIKKQESDLLRPMVESVTLSEHRIQKELSSIGKADQIDALNKKILQLLEKINSHFVRSEEKVLSIVNEHSKQNKEALSSLIRLIDAKNKTGLLDDLGKVYSKIGKP